MAKVTANQLSVSRIIMTPLILVMYEIGGVFGLATALVIQAVAEYTDLLDGKMARKYGVTKMGKILDPAADVILHVSMYASFLAHGQIPFIAFMLILWREVSVTLLRGAIALNKGRATPANEWGKRKTVAYAVNQLWLLLVGLLGELGVMNSYHIDRLNGVFLVVAVGLCVGSGLTYLIPGIKELNALDAVVDES